jgi:hypothetical protein
VGSAFIVGTTHIGEGGGRPRPNPNSRGRPLSLSAVHAGTLRLVQAAQHAPPRRDESSGTDGRGAAARPGGPNADVTQASWLSVLVFENHGRPPGHNQQARAKPIASVMVSTALPTSTRVGTNHGQSSHSPPGTGSIRLKKFKSPSP